MKDEKNQDIKHSIHYSKANFLKANWALLALAFLAVVVILSLCYVFLSPYLNKKSLEKDLATIQTTSLISADKIVCYSSAYGVNNNDNQARWNLNLSQYTDIAIYLNVQTSIKGLYIDNISFANSDIGNLSLSNISKDNFAKSPISGLLLSEQAVNSNSEDLNTSLEDENKINDNAIKTPKMIDLDLTLPITLRYLNNNFKENCLISDIETPLSFNGSLLKRGKIILSSLKNTISFTLHAIDNSNQEFICPISIPINLENSESGKSIYDGNYMEEISLSNKYFYVKN